MVRITVHSGLRKVRNNALGVAMPLVVLACVLAAVAGCGSKRIDTAKLEASWASYQSEHFTFHYPYDSPRAERITVFAAECEEILAHVMRVLQVAPDQRIGFFIFTTDAQADSVLHRSPGFFADGRLFLRIGQYPGGIIALAGCSCIDPKAPSFPVLKAGMYQLYAQPAINVHAQTFGFERQNRFVSLAELADTTLTRDAAVYSAEAASLCAYLLAKHGPERFKMLWRSVLGFTDSLERIYRLEIGRLEGDWRAYYRREAGRT